MGQVGLSSFEHSLRITSQFYFTSAIYIYDSSNNVLFSFGTFVHSHFRHTKLQLNSKILRQKNNLKFRLMIYFITFTRASLFNMCINSCIYLISKKSV